jgi:hypothetical protein
VAATRSLLTCIIIRSSLVTLRDGERGTTVGFVARGVGPKSYWDAAQPL